MNKIHYKSAEKLFKFTRQTWAKWQKEARPIVKLVNYFRDDEIQEFLKTNKMEKLELISNYTVQELKQLINSNSKKSTVKKGVLYSLLEKFDRTSLVYFLYIFENEPSIKDSKSLYEFINKSSKSNSIMEKVTEFLKSIKPTFVGGDNVSLDLHIDKFKKNCEQYLDEEDLDFILSNKDEYYNIIMEIAEIKR